MNDSIENEIALASRRSAQQRSTPKRLSEEMDLKLVVAKFSEEIPFVSRSHKQSKGKLKSARTRSTNRSIQLVEFQLKQRLERYRCL